MRSRVCLIILFCTTAIASSKATHIVGGELNYVIINDSTYQFTLNAYRDCFLGIPLFDNPALFNIFDGDNNFIRRIGVTRPPWDTLPVELTDPCLVAPPNVCVERVRYRFNLVLPPNNSGYQVAYQRCCRNATILNIFDDKEDTPESSGATYYAYIPPVRLYKNSNPVFNNFPPVAICANRRLEFDHAATDPDGDSLVYKLCTPFDGLSPTAPTISFLLEAPPYDEIRWRSPYSLNNQLSGPEPLQIDPKSGLLTAIPGRVGQFVVGVCVEEYRDGQYISETRRDFQFNVADCATVTRARFQSIDTSCNNKSVSFQNQSVNATAYLWDFGDGNTSTQASPTYTYLHFGTYTVTLIANPGAECADTFRKTIFITEDQLIIQAPDISVCSGENTSLELGFSNGIISSVIWTFNQQTLVSNGPSLNLPANVSGTVFYIATSGAGCRYSGSFELTVNPAPAAAILAEPSVILRGQSSTLSTNFIEELQYEWRPANSLSNAFQAVTLATPLQSSWYYLYITDSRSGCTGMDSVFVKVIDCADTLQAAISILHTGNCSGNPFTFMASSGLEDASYFWDFGEGSNSQGAFAEHLFTNTGSFLVTLVAIKEELCADTVTQIIDVAAPLGYNTSDYSACLGEAILINLSITGNENYLVTWTALSELAIPFDTISLTVDESRHLTFQITTATGCQIRDSIWVEVVENNISAEVDKVSVSPGETVQLMANPSEGNSFYWSPEELVSNPNIPNPTAAPVFSTVFTVLAINNEGCRARDSVMVTVNGTLDCDQEHVYIPSAFSPNGDGKNDLWRVRSKILEALTVQVYNRWGQLVYTSDRLDGAWDGLFNGLPASAGVYGYYVKALCIGGESIERKGNLTLIR
jgi:gliding motility-associated-like protein